jgi:peptidoglycan-associated lipoprotein
MVDDSQAKNETPVVAKMKSDKLETVYFDLDRWELSTSARDTLKQNAEMLKSSEGWTALTIEGHCDERGSDEYNLALGARRAKTVARYLKDLGVPESRLRTVSFGEARPAVDGHDELAWERNRRSEFRVDDQRTASR